MWLTAIQVLGTLILALVGSVVTVLIARGNNQVQQKTSEITAQANAITGLATLSDQRGEEISRLQSEMKLKDARISYLEQTNVSLQAQLWALTTEKEAMTRQLHDQAGQIETLNTQNAQQALLLQQALTRITSLEVILGTVNPANNSSPAA